MRPSTSKTICTFKAALPVTGDDHCPVTLDVLEIRRIEFLELTAIGSGRLPYSCELGGIEVRWKSFA